MFCKINHNLLILVKVMTVKAWIGKSNYFNAMIMQGVYI